MNTVFLIGMPGIQEWIIILVMILIPFFCLADIFRSAFPSPLTKLAWAATVIFIPLFGAVLYYWIGTEQKVVNRN